MDTVVLCLSAGMCCTRVVDVSYSVRHWSERTICVKDETRSAVYDNNYKKYFIKAVSLTSVSPYRASALMTYLSPILLPEPSASRVFLYHYNRVQPGAYPSSLTSTAF